MDIVGVEEEYRLGDADKRMSLLLFSRDHRDAFAMIEMDDPSDLTVPCCTWERCCSWKRSMYADER